MADVNIKSVKHGGQVFITDVPFKTLTIPVLKASTGRWHSAFFPYDGQGKPLPKEQIFAHKEIADYLNSRKTELLKGRRRRKSPTGICTEEPKRLKMWR